MVAAILNAVVLCVAVLLILGLIVWRRGAAGGGFGSSGILSVEHILEVCRGLARIRRAAIDRSDVEFVPSRDMEDPRYYVTKKRLLVQYVIRQYADKYAHDLSLSVAGQKTPHEIGSFYMALIGHLLHLDPTGLEVQISPKRRYYLEFKLTKAQQRGFEERKIDIPEITAVPELKETVEFLRDRMTFRRFD